MSKTLWPGFSKYICIDYVGYLSKFENERVLSCSYWETVCHGGVCVSLGHINLLFEGIPKCSCKYLMSAELASELE
jgi:hypothetical protein